MRIELIGINKVRDGANLWTCPRPERGVVPQYARYLLAAGVPPEEPLEALRGGTVCFESYTVGHWAGLTIHGGDTTPMKWAKYKSFNLQEVLG